MSDATADAAGEDQDPPKKASKLPLLIGLVLALAGGGGGFYAAWSGLLPFGGAGSDAGHTAPADTHGAEPADGHGAADAHASPADAHGAPAGGHGAAVTVGNVAFLELPPMVASLGPVSAMHHLRFRASLEVEANALHEVELLQPRIVDVLNNYLRALEPRDIEAQGALIRLRSQMLRRIQLVAGERRVRDLLVQEFVLN